MRETLLALLAPKVLLLFCVVSALQPLACSSARPASPQTCSRRRNSNPRSANSSASCPRSRRARSRSKKTRRARLACSYQECHLVSALIILPLPLMTSALGAERMKANCSSAVDAKTRSASFLCTPPRTTVQFNEASFCNTIIFLSLLLCFLKVNSFAATSGLLLCYMPTRCLERTQKSM